MFVADQNFKIDSGYGHRDLAEEACLLRNRQPFPSYALYSDPAFSDKKGIRTLFM